MPLSACASHFFTVNNLTLRDDAAEWEGVAGAIGVAREDLLMVRQVHEATVAVASPDRRRPWPRPDADAIVSNDPGAAIVVRVADCVAILLAEETGRAVAAIHAGWRGTAKRAAISGVSALQATYGVRPERMIAAVGPSIGPCCYEVVGGHTPGVPRGRPPHLDAGALVRAPGRRQVSPRPVACDADQLEGAGVMPDNIHVAELCTKTHADVFHSHRVQGAKAGTDDRDYQGQGLGGQGFKRFKGFKRFRWQLHVFCFVHRQVR